MRAEDSSRSAPRSRFRPKHRISHTKSRNGCYTCKQRHVKCDEERPTCGACSVRGEDCVFPNQGGTRDQRRQRPHFPRERLSSESLHPQERENVREVPFRPLEFHVAPSEDSQNVDIQPSSGLNMGDLTLLQHYLLHTSKKMTLHKIKSVVWEHVIPEMAVANEFLMHLVLALAGLDILTLENNRDGNDRSSPHPPICSYSSRLQSIMEHHQQGLSGLQKVLCANGEPDAEALLAGSMLIVGFVFASFGIKDLDPSIAAPRDGTTPGPASPSPLPDDGIPHIQWLHLVRGVTSILQQFWPTLRTCRLRSLLFNNNANEDWRLAETNLRSSIVLSDNIRSKRLRNFASGANHAMSALRDQFNGLRLSGAFLEDAVDSPLSTTPHSDRIGKSGKALADIYDQAIAVVEDLYLRILYVMQLKPLGSQLSSDLELQTELEDAAISGWPRLLSEDFISTLEPHGNADMLQGLSLAILAYLYVTIAILDDLWYCGKRVDVEIRKIRSVVVSVGDANLDYLTEWPVRVIGWSIYVIP